MDDHLILVTAGAASGAGDEVIISIAGRASRQMLSRYSHVRNEANREALAEIAARHRAAEDVARKNAEVEAQATRNDAPLANVAQGLPLFRVYWWRPIDLPLGGAIALLLRTVRRTLHSFYNVGAWVLLCLLDWHNLPGLSASADLRHSRLLLSGFGSNQGGGALHTHRLIWLVTVLRGPEPGVRQCDSTAICPALVLALNCGMRVGEIRKLRWTQIDFEKRFLVVGKSRTAAGTGRPIPLNETILNELVSHASWYGQRFEETRPEWYLFPGGGRYRRNPAVAIRPLKSIWTAVREKAGVKGRWHDNRHTLITELAESGAGDQTIMEIAGHVSRQMLERYSHIRMEAKRDTLEALASRRRSA